MNKILLFLLFSLPVVITNAQNFNGQWKGSFKDISRHSGAIGGDECEYVLEIETTDGNEVSGSSYTYFTNEGKRYYTICKITGFINKADKYIEIRETQRTKTNLPAFYGNTFQVHKLYFKQENDLESLSGRWVPAPNQPAGGGYGPTYLERRNLQAYLNSNNRRTTHPTNLASRSNTPPKPPTNNATAQTTKKIQSTNQHPQTKEKSASVTFLKTEAEMPLAETSFSKIPQVKLRENQLYSRKLDLIKTIQVHHPAIKVTVYDNGVVDGDSISLYYNKKLILSNFRLCDKGYTFTLPIDESETVNQLVMHAENLGTIPPNTAIMLVMDGDKRYEVRISSDLTKSGAINFIYNR